ncbi:MAG TPA: hypothetical protein VK810_01220, partial [Dongiaceae bacterium]|nr:hypothetical protein [Dongiaceae bacterium]
MPQTESPTKQIEPPIRLSAQTLVRPEPSKQKFQPPVSAPIEPSKEKFRPAPRAAKPEGSAIS